MTRKKQPTKADIVSPLPTSRFALHGHGYRQCSAIVPNNTSESSLVNPLFWTHCRARLQAGDEIRVVTEDYRNRWVLLVTSVGAGTVGTLIVESTTGAQVQELPGVESKYEIKQRGVLKWCVVDKETDENILDGIPTEHQAIKQRDDLIRARAM